MTMTKVHVAMVRADITKILNFTVTGCRYERFGEASTSAKHCPAFRNEQWSRRSKLVIG